MNKNLNQIFTAEFENKEAVLSSFFIYFTFSSINLFQENNEKFNFILE